MSNHYHLVVKLSPDDAIQWTDDEVMERWCSLHRGSILVQRYRAGIDLGTAETATVRDTIAVYRKRLADLSWFMKCLNEPIARRANAEDGCTGHFWEARFSSQALRTDAALLACMVYVDLNPIRAGIAKTPESSDYTSISERLMSSVNLEAAIQEMLERTELKSFNQPIRPLKSFADADHASGATMLPMPFSDYRLLVDTTGRIVRGDKRAAIDQTLNPILERMQLEQDKWVHATTNFEQMYRRRQRIA
jgi:hypothetical protein